MYSPHPDMLTCGACAKRFVLADIVKFIHHKVNSCNKENDVQCNGRDGEGPSTEDKGGAARGRENDNGHENDEEEPMGNDDEEVAEVNATDVVRRTPSISAPLAGRRPGSRPSHGVTDASSPQASPLRRYLTSGGEPPALKRRRDEEDALADDDDTGAASRDPLQIRSHDPSSSKEMRLASPSSSCDHDRFSNGESYAHRATPRDSTTISYSQEISPTRVNGFDFHAAICRMRRYII